jgi:cytochrome c oxidase assembly protein Cox11
MFCLVWGFAGALVSLDALAALAVHGQRRIALQFGQHRVHYTAWKHRPAQACV